MAPTGVDEVFVPSNGVITLNLNRLPAKKKTEGLQYQQVPSEPRKGRVSGLKKAVFRVSCLVFRENLGIRAGLRIAPGKPASRVSCFVKTLEISGLWQVNALEDLIRDPHGLCLAAIMLSRPGRKKKD
ncbi:MAG: hypothetical protein OXL36_11870 [Bryobacterales bacterium]|nr:hypothetical protein [Bryobacterales bacterium]